ncbi:MAG: ABC transporter substrate-binding protein [Candidatus Latescibacteria bacterium]|jgi:phospholipid transport system substrate-binding protein|nr:ABC transporter substrate-binding protein [Candidatus Latescibacterota bacterium]
MNLVLRNLIFVLFFASSAVASDQGEALLNMVKERDQAIQDIVRSETKGETPEERAKLKAIVGDLFDFETFSKESLGRDWAERTEAELKEFVDVNRQLIERNYADPKLYTKADKIDYTGVEVEDTASLVKTVVHYKRETSLIDYKLHLVDGKWLIYDMVIDDLSVARSNRSQFRREIRKSSFAGLMDKLKKKLKEDGADKKGGT